MSDDGIELSLPKGLVGFPALSRFLLFEPADAYPLKFLHSMDREGVNFACIDPAGIKPDYAFSLSDEDAGLLSLEQPSDALILALLVIPEDPRRMTMNLAGPIVVNVRTRVALQVILNAEEYPLQFPVLSQ